MKRRGVSPIIAEFGIMVLVIIAAVPLFGYTFGSLARWTKPAEVTVSSSDCGPGFGNTTSCSFVITNLGASNTQTVPTVILYITQGNQTRATVTNSCTGDAGLVVHGGSTLQLSCSFAIAPGAPGDMYGGSILFANGAQVPFTGRFD